MLTQKAPGSGYELSRICSGPGSGGRERKLEGSESTATRPGDAEASLNAAA